MNISPSINEAPYIASMSLNFSRTREYITFCEENNQTIYSVEMNLVDQNNRGLRFGFDTEEAAIMFKLIYS